MPPGTSFSPAASRSSVFILFAPSDGQQVAFVFL
jgi:hypothetical protein